MQIINIIQSSISQASAPALRCFAKISSSSKDLVLEGNGRTWFPVLSILLSILTGKANLVCGWDARSQVVASLAGLVSSLLPGRKVRVVWCLHETPGEVSLRGVFGKLRLWLLKVLSPFVSDAIFPNAILQDLYIHQGVVCKQAHIISDGLESIELKPRAQDDQQAMPPVLSVYLSGVSLESVPELAGQLSRLQNQIANLEVNSIDLSLRPEQESAHIKIVNRQLPRPSLNVGAAAVGLGRGVVYLPGSGAEVRALALRMLGTDVTVIVDDSPLARFLFEPYALFVDGSGDISFGKKVSQTLSYSVAEYQALKSAATDAMKGRYSVSEMIAGYRRVLNPDQLG